MSDKFTARCACGHATFGLSKLPAHGLICHCSVCQKVYGQPFSDVTIMAARHVSVPQDSGIVFDKYKGFPAINRGVCESCRQPMVGFMTYGPGLRAAYVARVALGALVDDVRPALHVFYGTRTADVDDDLPKYSGDMTSFLAATPTVVRAILR